MMSGRPDDLRDLLDKAAEGDDVAMGELVRRTQVDVWRLCTALGSRGDEADLVQDTYLRAMRSLGTYRGDASVRTWLLAIARNVCADHVRSRVRRRRLEDRAHDRAVLDDTVRRAADTGPAPIDDVLAALDPDRREAFALTQLLGLSYDEAAVALDCPVGTIRSRVSRARVELTELIRRAEAS